MAVFAPSSLIAWAGVSLPGLTGFVSAAYRSPPFRPYFDPPSHQPCVSSPEPPSQHHGAVQCLNHLFSCLTRPWMPVFCLPDCAPAQPERSHGAVESDALPHASSVCQPCTGKSAQHSTAQHSTAQHSTAQHRALCTVPLVIRTHFW